MPNSKKIMALDAAERWVRDQQASGRRVGFTCGAFDLLHAGHVAYLARARQVCDQLIVAVNSDLSIKAYKNPLRPVVPQNQRMAVIAGLEAVNAVTLMEDKRPASLLDRLRPDFYIKGGDYSVAKLRSRSVVEAYGGSAIVIPVDVEISSSRIIERAATLAIHVPPPRPPAVADQRIALLDRDGTIIRNVPFLHEPDRVELIPGAGNALAKLQALGFRLAIVTNQQGIGLGYFGMDAFIATNQAVFKALAPFGVKIWRLFFCPHSLADDCACRKPRTALLSAALTAAGTDSSRCCVIGDAPSDVLAGQSLGIPSYQVGTPIYPTIAEAAAAIERSATPPIFS